MLINKHDNFSAQSLIVQHTNIGIKKCTLLIT